MDKSKSDLSKYILKQHLSLLGKSNKIPSKRNVGKKD
jgi:hypothetical protein